MSEEMTEDRACIVYFEMGQWPLQVGFTMDPKAYDAELERIRVHPDVRPEFPSNEAHASFFPHPEGGELTCIVAMASDLDRTDPEVIGLIAHECMHIVQELWKFIGETNPGDETEAYLLGYLVQLCVSCPLPPPPSEVTP